VIFKYINKFIDKLLKYAVVVKANIRPDTWYPALPDIRPEIYYPAFGLADYPAKTAPFHCTMHSVTSIQKF
jgi:hypothetical protein